MIELLIFALGLLGILSMRKEWHTDGTLYGEGVSYARPSYSIPGYHDDEQTRQARRRERAKDRRAEESRFVSFQCPSLHSHIPHGIL
jgi:hypothetical protein